jgi:hypothetical protein
MEDRLNCVLHPDGTDPFMLLNPVREWRSPVARMIQKGVVVVVI